MRVVVTGAGGQLGADLARALDEHDAVLLSRAALDVTDPSSVAAVLRSARPDVVIHAAAWTDVDACELDPERAQLVNALGTQHVVESAGNALVVVVSTDYVFDGTLGRAYVESDAPAPVQVYGATKRRAEELALASSARVAIARSAWLYGARRADGASPSNFVTAVLRRSASGPIDVVADQVGSPTSTSDLARALVELAVSEATGVFHVVNEGAVSRADLARAAIEAAGGSASAVRAVSTAEAAPRPARRPSFAPLEGRAWAAAGFAPLAPWDEALARALPDILAAL